ncbi:hypothetical protein GCM10009117_16050 [Gangjinia marincola]|uniref:Uncharacterized protein n=1 Tax=Gangjinia marincola TaxID=578463 RepID=A0ABP3XSP4_9FLAO
MRKVSSEEILHEEKAGMDWDKVESYPAFKDCGETNDSAVNKRCFEEHLTRHVQTVLEKRKESIRASVNETAQLYLTVSKEGKTKVDSVNISAALKTKIPFLKELLLGSLDSLPQLQPALKRGIPVKTAFTLPVTISTD